MSKKFSNPKRYNLVLPQELFNDIKRVADKHNSTAVEVIRKYIRFGLLAEKNSR